MAADKRARLTITIRGWEACDTPGCEFPAGHQDAYPCGRRVVDGEPCGFCGQPEPCADCWQPRTVAAFKGLCAEAGKDVDLL